MSDVASSASGGHGLPLLRAVPFAEERRELLLERSRLLYALGLATSVLLIALARVVIETGPSALGVDDAMDALHLCSFAAALVSLKIGRPDLRRLEATAFAVLAVNLTAAVVNLGGGGTDYPPGIIVALLLFIPAAVIPWRLRYQVALGLVAVLATVGVPLVSHATSAATRAYWDGLGGGSALTAYLLGAGIGIAVLAAVACIVTHRLYSLHRRTHGAMRLGSYTVEREIGRGAMGEVHLATHPRMCRPAAVKVLRCADDEDGATIARFEREIRLASSLSHPNTITIFDYGRAGRSTFYYAMEYLNGLDLRTLVELHGPAEPARAAHLLRQACASLAEAHALGVLHRDLKPANVFLTRLGLLYDFVKVLDFGLARRTDEELAGDVPGGHLTRVGQVLGTPMFIAPESIKDGGSTDARTDVYGLGAVAYFLLAGRGPFRGPSAADFLVQHLTVRPEPPSAVRRAGPDAVPTSPAARPATRIPEALDAIVLRCLEKRPEDRFGTVTALAGALEEVEATLQPWTQERARAWWEAFRPADPSPVSAPDVPRWSPGPARARGAY